MNIAIIIARAGSKRIKNKNIKFFFGKPIIAYPILIALESKIFNRVIVSTESMKISKISKSYGAEIPFKRPEKLANSKASTASVIQHVIKKLSLKRKKKVNICCIYPVTPLLSKKTILKGYKKFKRSGGDFLVPVSKKEKIGERFFSLNKKGYLRETKNKKKKLYCDTGQFYWGNNKSFLKYDSAFKGNSVPLLISKENGIDVNTKEDWKKLIKIYRSKYFK